jgi:hypothetical protein
MIRQDSRRISSRNARTSLGPWNYTADISVRLACSKNGGCARHYQRYPAHEQPLSFMLRAARAGERENSLVIYATGGKAVCHSRGKNFARRLKSSPRRSSGTW